jgi:AbrB family looped-hinge helix DNA binding protein
MREFVSSVSPKGQITIPAEVRRLLGVKPKDKITIIVEGEAVTLQPARSRLDAIYQSVEALTPPRTDEEIEAIVEEEIAQDAAREGL